MLRCLLSSPVRGVVPLLFSESLRFSAYVLHDHSVQRLHDRAGVCGLPAYQPARLFSIHEDEPLAADFITYMPNAHERASSSGRRLEGVRVVGLLKWVAPHASRGQTYMDHLGVRSETHLGERRHLGCQSSISHGCQPVTRASHSLRAVALIPPDEPEHVVRARRRQLRVGRG